jgi:hypothetical protein
VRDPIASARARNWGGPCKSSLSAIAALFFLLMPVGAHGGWERNEIEEDASQDIMSVAVGDADNDGDNEVVTGGDGSGVRIYDGSKSDWTFEQIIEELHVTSVLIGDADNDGKQEIVCSTFEGMILLFERDGADWVVHTVERQAGEPIFSLCCGDGDNDGSSEIVAGTEKDYVYLYEGSGDSWDRSTVDNRAGRYVYAVAVGDGDGDGSNEIVAGTGSKSVFIYEYDSGTWTRSNVDANAAPGVASVAVGDCDKDGKSEVYAGTTAKKIHRYEYNGSNWSKENVDNSVGGDVCGLEICDLNGDGWNELIALGRSKKAAGSIIVIYERGPQQWFRLEADNHVTGEAMALDVGDADDDGKVELVAGSSVARKAFVYDEFLLLRISRRPESDEIVIKWESEPGAAYDIYYSDSAYSGFGYVSTVEAVGDTTEWVDNGTSIPVHPKDVVARYYRVRKESPDVYSNTVGKFTRTFKTVMNLTSIPLVQYSTWIQDVISTQLTGAPDEGYADRVWKWNPLKGGYDFAWLVEGLKDEHDGRWWCPNPFGPSKMALDFGDGFFVQSKHGEQKVTFVGRLPEGVVRMRGLNPGLQMIGAPWAEPVLLDSTDLDRCGAHPASSEDLADRIWRWDEEALKYKYYWLMGSANGESNLQWWETASDGPADTPMIPGYGYWYQARGQSFFWSFLK